MRKEFKMNQKIKDLLSTVDVLNTLHGGVSEPFLSISEYNDGQQLRVRVPGIEKEDLEAEVNNNVLTIYFVIPIRSSHQEVRMPRIVYNEKIPYFIDVNAIKASYEGNELVVRMPYNELSNGYSKKIKAA